MAQWVKVLAVQARNVYKLGRVDAAGKPGTQ